MAWPIPQIPLMVRQRHYCWWAFLLILLLWLIGYLLLILLDPTTQRSSNSVLLLDHQHLFFCLELVLLTFVGYALPIEHEAIKVAYWQRWRINDLAAWQNWSQQRRQITDYALVTAEIELSTAICHGKWLDLDEEFEPSELFINQYAPTGWMRYELICQSLLIQLVPSITSLLAIGTMNVYLQLADGEEMGMDEKQHAVELLKSIWREQGFDPKIQIQYLASENASVEFEQWIDTQADEAILLLAIQYRHGNSKNNHEIGAALLYQPGDDNGFNYAYRSMTTTAETIEDDLQQLIVAGQQSVDVIDGIWLSGIDDQVRQDLLFIAYQLKLPLAVQQPPFGLYNLTNYFEISNNIRYWLLQVLACERLKISKKAQLLLSMNQPEQINIQLVGNTEPVIEYDKRDFLDQPLFFASACLVLALALPLLISVSLLLPLNSTVSILLIFFLILLPCFTLPFLHLWISRVLILPHYLQSPIYGQQTHIRSKETAK